MPRKGSQTSILIERTGKSRVNITVSSNSNKKEFGELLAKQGLLSKRGNLTEHPDGTYGYQIKEVNTRKL